MADKHSLNYEVRELKLGSSFTNNKNSQYHTIKYDFKPASVDVNKMASVDVATNNQVTVTVPHLDGAGVPQTVFKGNQRPYTKECVLIIDRVTGEITLEKLSSNIQVKKTRQETAQKPRPQTPVATDMLTNTTQRSSSRTRVATNRRTAQPVPGGANQSSGQNRYNGNPPSQKPPNMVRSPQRVKASPPQVPWSGGGNSTLASLPMIGFDDGPEPVTALAPSPPPPAVHNGINQRHDRNNFVPERPVERPQITHQQHTNNTLPSQHSAEDSSSSSSSDSGSDSESGSDSDDNSSSALIPVPNGESTGPALPSDVLNDDLCLSESGSDSD